LTLNRTPSSTRIHTSTCNTLTQTTKTRVTAPTRIAASPRDIYASGQPRGSIEVKALLMQLDVCNWGIASPDWDVSAERWSNRRGSQCGPVHGCGQLD